MAAAIVLGTATAASADISGPTAVGDYCYTADSSNVDAGATVTGWANSCTSGGNSPGTEGASDLSSLPTSVDVDGTTYSVTTIGSYSFSNVNLTSVVLPDSITTVSDQAFYYNPTLTTVSFPDSLKTIGNWSFYATGLSDITIPDSVITIGDYAFYSDDYYNYYNGGRQLNSITLGDSVQTIGTEAFYFPYWNYQSSAFTTLTIPASVTTISFAAFYGLPLSDVYFEGAAPAISDSALSNYGATVHFKPQFGADRVDGGFTVPDWAGYTTSSPITLGFDTQGGSTAPEDQNIGSGYQADAPVDPTRVGYAFDGWYTAATDGDKWDFGTAFTTDATLYAHWTASNAALTFESEGGSRIDAATVSIGTAADAPTAPTRAGYTFAGWYTAADGGDEWDFTDNITGDTTLYAHWLQLPIVTGSALTAGKVGAVYTASISADGPTASDFEVTSGALPQGLSLNAVTGAISGTPETSGTFTFTVGVTNEAGTTSAQYSIAVSLPDGRLSVSASRVFVTAGQKVTLAISGLASGEAYAVTLNGATLATGTASTTGKTTQVVILPSTLHTGAAKLVVTGSTESRTGAATESVVAKSHKLTFTVKPSNLVGSNRNVTITVHRLAAGEPVTVTFRGHRVSGKTAHADSHGNYKVTFSAGWSWGYHTVKAVGSSAHRYGSVRLDVESRSITR